MRGSNAAAGAEYQQRLAQAAAEETRLAAEDQRASRWRAWILVAAIIAGWASFGFRWFSPVWLALIVIAFVALAVRQERNSRAWARAKRAAALYRFLAARVSGDWPGRGRNGAEFADAEHLFSGDLDLFGAGSLFERISVARTSMGEQTLAAWLLHPAAAAEIKQRQAAVEELAPRLAVREEIALAGEEARADLKAARLRHWGEAEPVRFFAGAAWVLPLLAVLLVAGLVAWALGVPATLAPVVLIALLLNYALRHPVDRVIAALDAPALDLRILAHLVEQIRSQQFESAKLRAIQERLPAAGVIRSLERRIAAFDQSRNQLFLPLAMVLLWRPQWARAIEQWRQQHGASIGDWLDAVGEFEALSSLASLRYELAQASCYPEITTEREYAAEGLWHVLLPADRAVENDVSLGGARQLLLVSGSNMSGKSTLMRALGLSVVLAFAGGPVAARRLRLGPCRLGASIRVNDSVIEGRSRFFAEISRLSAVVKAAGGDPPVLFLLDELLSGTNSHDRQQGAEGLLRGLLERGAFGITTTHDLALIEIARTLPQAANFHFEDSYRDGAIHFDYQLRSGPVERGNAIALMRSIGLDV